MNRLIINEFKKVKISRIMFFEFLLVLSLILMQKLSDKSVLDLSFYLIVFIGIVMCILFGGTVNGEIENGTMRFYLSKPYKRWKIYLSKVIAMISFTLFSIMIVIFISCLLNNSFAYEYVLKYIFHCTPLIFMCFFSIYLSTAFKSQILSSSISILIFCFSLIISQVFFGLGISIIQYTFLPYLDFSLFNDEIILLNMNKELNISLSQNKALIINLIYSIFFLALGIIKFNKKDIKN